MTCPHCGTEIADDPALARLQILTEELRVAREVLLQKAETVVLAALGAGRRTCAEVQMRLVGSGVVRREDSPALFEAVVARLLSAGLVRREVEVVNEWWQVPCLERGLPCGGGRGGLSKEKEK